MPSRGAMSTASSTPSPRTASSATPTGPDYWGQSFKGKAAIRGYFEPLFASASDVAWRHTSEFICGNRAVTEWHRTATLADRREAVVAGLRPLHLPPRPDRHEGHLHQGRRLKIPLRGTRVSITCYRYTALPFRRRLRMKNLLQAGAGPGDGSRLDHPVPRSSISPPTTSSSRSALGMVLGVAQIGWQYRAQAADRQPAAG